MSPDSIPEIGLQQIDAILEYLPVFERGDFQPGQWVEKEGQLPSVRSSPCFYTGEGRKAW